MTEDLDYWNGFLNRIEDEMRSAKRTKAISLKKEVEEAVDRAERTAPLEIQDRLDVLLLQLTDLSKENVCTNTKCPHYNKKCKMR